MAPWDYGLHDNMDPWAQCLAYDKDLIFVEFMMSIKVRLHGGGGIRLRPGRGYDLNLRD